MVLSSLVLASVAAPFLPKMAGPLAISQARRPRIEEDVISDAGQQPPIARSQSVSDGGGKSQGRRKAKAAARSPLVGSADGVLSASATPKLAPQQIGKISPRLPQAHDDGVVEVYRVGSGLKDNPPGAAGSTTPKTALQSLSPTLKLQNNELSLSSSSLPETVTRAAVQARLPTPPHSAGLQGRSAQLHTRHRRHTHSSRAPTSPAMMTRKQKVHMLRSNYFRSEMAFLMALQDISNRLVVVPKPARNSALRAELGLIAQDLPAEVDIPVICPASLEDGIPSKSRHHRIVRLNPAEATSLNSAERVPFLLMVEVIRDDFDFDPDTEENTLLLNKILAEQGPLRRRLFDISDAMRMKEEQRQQQLLLQPDSVLEPANGDLGNAALVNLGQYSSEETLTVRGTGNFGSTNGTGTRPLPIRTSSGNMTGRSSLTVYSTPRSSSHLELSRNGSPSGRRSLAAGPKSTGTVTDQTDVSALATHMRTAAQMLAQLDQSSSKRPKNEVAAIKAKIIASMQSLEEQSFVMDDPASNPNGPTFDTIMAKDESGIGRSQDVSAAEFGEVVDDDVTVINTAAGQARMENDQITGGVRRLAIGDRDDPSAATFGEDWDAKKDRITSLEPIWMDDELGFGVCHCQDRR